MPAVQLDPAPSPLVQPAASPTWRRIVTGALLLIILVTSGGAFLLERYEFWEPLLVVAALALLLRLTGWWRYRAAVVVVTADLLLVFAYLWSLDDRVLVVVRATPSGYTAKIGSDTLPLNVPAHSGRVGLYAGGFDEYRVQPIGEGFDFSTFDPISETGEYEALGTAPLDRFGQWVRLATPRPAWANVRITQGGTAVPWTLDTATPIGGNWRQTVRGEWEGDPGAGLILAPSLGSSFTMTAELMRGDGTQGLLVGANEQGRGYLLVVRMDQPDAIWYAWLRGTRLSTLATTSLHVSLLPTIQRDVRLLLGNAMAAFLLLLLTPLLYLLFAGFLRMTGGGSKAADTGSEVAGIERALLSGRRPLLLGGLIGIAGIAACALIASTLLERIPHVQDSVAYLFQAKTLALGRLSVPVSRLPSFFTEEFIPMYHGQWFGKYPPGWPVLLTIGVILNAPWLVNPVLTGLNLFLIVLIGREVYGRSVGLLGALLALVSPFVLFLGGSFMAHTATVTYLTGFAWLLIRWVKQVERGETGRLVDRKLLAPAGFLLGMGFLTRQLDAVAFAIPFALLALSPAIRQRLAAVRWLAGGAAIPCIILLLYNWAQTGNPLVTPYSLWWKFDHLGFGPMTGISGFTPAQGFWNTSLNLEFLLIHLFGWPFYLTLALAAIPFLLGRATRWDAIFGLSAVCVMAAYIFYWTSGVMYGPRYYFAAVPWLALLTARGLEELYRWPLRLPLRVRPDRLAALLVPTFLAGALLVYNLRVYLPAQIPVYQGYNFTSAASLNAVQRAGIHHALVFVASHPSGTWWSYGSVFSANSPHLDGDIVYAHDEGSADHLLIAQYPGRSYWRLDYTTLTRMQP
jgi:4-amino-4-deoxy-L-arabinose transferase-like glycosyltransferase